MREPIPSQEYFFNVQDWRDITTGIEHYIAGLSDGYYGIRVSYERGVLEYSIKYFHGKTFSLIDRTANLEVLRVDRYTGGFRRFGRNRFKKNEDIFKSTIQQFFGKGY